MKQEEGIVVPGSLPVKHRETQLKMKLNETD